MYPRPSTDSCLVNVGLMKVSEGEIPGGWVIRLSLMQQPREGKIWAL